MLTVPGSGASGAQPRRTARASEVSVTSVWARWARHQCQAASGDRERDGEPSPATKVWWPRWLLAVDCCCCCPLSPSNPLNTIMYPYSIIQPP